MQENQLTQTSQQVLHAAQLLAQKQRHAAVTEEHFLASLLQEDTQVLPYLMQQNNIVLPAVKAALEQHLKRQAKVEGGSHSSLQQQCAVYKMHFNSLKKEEMLISLPYTFSTAYYKAKAQRPKY